MNDKYAEMRDTVARVSKEVIGKGHKEAAAICAAAGLACRWTRVDGDGCMVTADCRMDRIGFVIEKGIVTEVQNG